MRRLLVVAAEELSLHAATSIALRTKPTGPVGLVMLPGRTGTLSPDEAASGVNAGRGARLPLPTPGAVRLAAQLRTAGHAATARWRLVICSPDEPEKVDDALAIIEAACGSVTALSTGVFGDSSEVSVLGCDLAVGVVPVDAPPELLSEAKVALMELGRASAVVQLAPLGLGGALPLAGICPPPEWVAALDSVSGRLTGRVDE